MKWEFNMFQVTADMNIEEEIKARQTEIFKIQFAASSPREYAMMSDDLYLVNGGDRSTQEKISTIQAEIKVLKRGYISPEVYQKAAELYKDFDGGVLENSGDYVTGYWIDAARMQLG
jgi:hypothetical protein